MAINRPIKDMKCQTEKAGKESKDLATSEVELVTYEVKDLFGAQF